jgi:uncharacterized DUF497 family protein
MQFEWDAKKEQANIRKHNVTFSEAKTVFSDEFAILEYDSVHSETEERFHLLGRSIKNNVLLVVFCEKDPQNTEVYHIISARKAIKSERSNYAQSLTKRSSK